MSDANRIQVSFLREVTWDTTPSSAFQELLVTGGRFAHDLETVQSQQIRTDAQGAGAKRVAADASAEYNVEWSPAAFDELLRGGIRSDSDWSTAVNHSGTDIAAEPTGNKYTSSSTDLPTNVTAGQWVYVAGFSNAANNGWKKVTSTTSTEMVVTGATLVTEAAGLSVTMKGSYIRNGTDKASYGLQEHFQDLTNKYLLITGARIGNWNVDISPQSIISGAFSFLGAAITQQSAASGNGSVTAAPSNDVLSEVDSVDDVWIDAASVSWDLFSFNFGVELGNRPQSKLGQLKKRGIGQGTLVLNGGFETYLDDNSWSVLGDLLSFTKFAFAIALKDATGKRYHIELPKVAYSSESGDIPGLDEDKMLNFQFQAEPGGTMDKTIQICRVS